MISHPVRGTRSRRRCTVTRTGARLSSSMNASRAGGYVGSSGTYAPPAFRMPSRPTIVSIERSMQIPTGTPRPIPRARSWRAS